jgi:heme/copper-type cytochrome/quinol oxidase subunit 4
MFSGLRAFGVIGGAIYLLIFLFLEKKTGIPFFSNSIIFVILITIWVVFIIILAVLEYRRDKEEDELYGKPPYKPDD